MYDTNTITKYNVVEETKDFAKDGEEITYFMRKDVWVEAKVSVLLILRYFMQLFRKRLMGL